MPPLTPSSPSGKRRGPFRSLFDFCQRVDLRKVNRRVIESLIKCGAFDFSKVYRSQMLTSLEEILDRSQSIQKKKGEAQISMFAASLKEEEPYPEIEEFPEKQLIAFEKETIGFYFSRHPLAHYQEAIKRMTQEDSSTLSERPNGAEVKICGLVSGLKEITTKKGDRMAFLTLEDMKGFVEVILFPEVFKSRSNACSEAGTRSSSGECLTSRTSNQAKIKGLEVRPLSETPSDPAEDTSHPNSRCLRDPSPARRSQGDRPGPSRRDVTCSSI